MRASRRYCPCSAHGKEVVSQPGRWAVKVPIVVPPGERIANRMPGVLASRKTSAWLAHDGLSARDRVCPASKETKTGVRSGSGTVRSCAARRVLPAATYERTKMSLQRQRNRGPRFRERDNLPASGVQLVFAPLRWGTFLRMDIPFRIVSVVVGLFIRSA